MPRVKDGNGMEAGAKNIRRESNGRSASMEENQMAFAEATQDVARGDAAQDQDEAVRAEAAQPERRFTQAEVD